MAAETNQPLKGGQPSQGKARFVTMEADPEIVVVGPAEDGSSKGPHAPQAEPVVSSGSPSANAQTAVPANAAGLLETLEELRGIKSSMQDVLLQLATKLSKHEEQLKVALSLSDLPPMRAVPPSAHRDSEGPSKNVTASFEMGTVITPQEIVGTGRGSSIPLLDAEEPLTPSIAKEESDRARKRSKRTMQLRKDVVALEVCEGWRNKLTDDFGGRVGIRDTLADAKIKANQPKVIDLIGCVLVIANTIFMLFEVEADMITAMVGEEEPSWVLIGNVVLCALFIFELIIRISTEKVDFICGHNWAWNLFDATCVLTQIMDLAFTSLSVSFMRVLRSVRVVRAARILKTARSLQELRVMMTVLAKSFTSVIWALIIILGIATMFTLFIFQVVASTVRDVGPSNMDPDLMRYFGSLGSCLQTLFVTITGGEYWQLSARPLWNLGVGYYIAYVCFHGFFALGMLNIVTAIFVESTLKISEADHSNVHREECQQDTSAFNQFRSLLEKAAEAEDGSITRSEFEGVIADAKGRRILRSMDILSHEAIAAFHLLDAENQGLSSITELTCTLKRMKGASRSLDLVTMLYENKRVTRYITSVQDSIELRLDRLKEAVEYTARKQALEELQELEAARIRMAATNPNDKSGRPKTMTDFIRDALDTKFAGSA